MKQVPHSPKMKSKLLLTYLQKTSENLDEVSRTPLSKFEKDTSSKWNQASRYEYRFNGYCYSCNGFGHKAMDCTFHGRRCGGSANNTVRCCTCNRIGHVAAIFHTMRCYNYSGFGHKSPKLCKSKKTIDEESFTHTCKEIQ